MSIMIPVEDAALTAQNKHKERKIKLLGFFCLICFFNDYLFATIFKAMHIKAFKLKI